MKMQKAATSVGLLVFAAFATVFTTTAKAQQECYIQGMSQITSLQGGIETPPIPLTAEITDQGNFETYWIVKCSLCAPPPECPTCNLGGAPIDLSTGNTSIAQTDIRVPGMGGGMTLARTWNSIWPPSEAAWRQGLFGPNWRSTYEERVTVGSDGYMKYSRGDGSFWSFGFTGFDSGPNPTYSPASPANRVATLTQGGTSWTIRFQNGETRVFDRTSGYLTSITDRNGNTTQLSYDNASRLVSVTDAASRHLYFSYASPSTYLVVGVTSDFGVSLSYAYDGQGRLTTVTRPDSTTVSFQYDSNSFISAILDSNGKVLEQHTYDVTGKGLTSSRAGGVEAITVSYPQPPQFKLDN